MKTYLITGCAGFIGSNFVHYMLKKYPEILLVNLDKLTYAGNLENLKDVEGDPRHVFVQGDICDKELVEGLFAKYDFDYVINFAAESHVDRSIKNPEIFVQSNVMGTVNLLQRAKEAWYDAEAKTWKEGKKYLQVSTDEVYGALGAEGFFMETTPLCPHSPYSSSKASADMFVMAFHDTYGMPINITRCSNNYGPYHFPEKLIPLMIANALNDKPLPVYGKGENVRDWLYVEDHCKAIDLIIHNGRVGEVYNIGGHNEMKNIDIVKIICKELGKPESLITYVTDRKGHDMRYAIDPTKIASMGPVMIIYVLLTLAFNGAKMCVTTCGTSFMADCIDYELYRSGKFVPAVVSGTYSLLDKIISSFGALIATAAVALLGYTTTMPQPGDPCTTPLFWMTMFLYFGLPILGWIVSLVAMRYCDLDKAKMVEIQKAIAEKKAAAKAEVIAENMK